MRWTNSSSLKPALWLLARKGKIKNALFNRLSLLNDKILLNWVVNLQPNLRLIERCPKCFVPTKLAAFMLSFKKCHTNSICIMLSTFCNNIDDGYPLIWMCFSTSDFLFCFYKVCCFSEPNRFIYSSLLKLLYKLFHSVIDQIISC